MVMAADGQLSHHRATPELLTSLLRLNKHTMRTRRYPVDCRRRRIAFLAVAAIPACTEAFLAPRQRCRSSFLSFRKVKYADMPLQITEEQPLNGKNEPVPQEKEKAPSLEEQTQAILEAVACAVDLENLSRPFVSRLDSSSTFVEFTEDGLAVPAGPVGQFKEEVANWLAQPIVEVSVAGLVLLGSFLVALSTIPSVPYANLLLIAEEVVGWVFAAEFLARWFSSDKEPGKFVVNAQFAVDVGVVVFPLLVTITPAEFWREIVWLPNWLTEPSGLINLLLLRVLRLRRVLRDKETFARFFDQGLLGLAVTRADAIKDWQLQLARVLLSLFTLLSVATGMIYTAEHQVNPQITDYFTALYFGLTTLTTVGFGDITPVTFGGRFIVCASILAGVTVIPAQAGSLLEALLARQESRGDRRRRKAREARMKEGRGIPMNRSMVLDTATQCTSCGAELHWSNARFCYYCGEEL